MAQDGRSSGGLGLRSSRVTLETKRAVVLPCLTAVKRQMVVDVIPVLGFLRCDETPWSEAMWGGEGLLVIYFNITVHH